MPSLTILQRQIIMIVAACAAVLLAWWLVFGRADRAVKKAAEANIGRVVAEKRGQAAVEAARIVEHHHEKITTIREIRDVGVTKVREASSDADAGMSARLTLCMLDATSYGDDPICQMQ